MDWEGAIVDLSTAIELNPEFAEAYFQRGFAKEHMNDGEGAIADFTKVIEIQPDQAFAYYCRGTSRFSNFGDKEGARADFVRAIELGYPVSQEEIALIFE